MQKMSRLGLVYSQTYGVLCGQYPHIRPWHFQWLAVKDLYTDLKRLLSQFTGRALDLGCGLKPYENWFTQADEYIGVDIHAGQKVDVVIDLGEVWPFPSESF